MSESKKPNLMARPLIDLREMLARENKLLANRRFIERLKDKGEKIRRFRDEIERAIKIKQSMEETESFLARLSLGEKAILPQHPMFSASTGRQDLKLAAARQSTSNEEPPKSKEVVKELLSGEFDIYSVALSKTFDEELSRRRSERFVLNRVPKSVQKTAEKQPPGQESAAEPAKATKKVSLATKYRDTALEVYDREEKLVALSIENSLEFGKEQKLKDFEVEKLRLENRLTWRAIREFDSDDSGTDDENGGGGGGSDDEDLEDVD